MCAAPTLWSAHAMHFRSFRLLILALILAHMAGLEGRAASAQSGLTPLKPPPIPAEQTNPGRWEIFAGGHDWPGEFASMSGVAVDAAGVVYIGDPTNKRIQKLSPDGATLGSIPIWPDWIGSVSTIQSIVVTPNGEIVVLFTNPMPLDGPEPYYGVRYAASGRPLGQFGRAGPAPEGL